MTTNFKRNFPTLQAWMMVSVFSSVFAFSASALPTYEIDLTDNADHSLKTIYGSYGFGGDALVGNFLTHPAGTGVFDPFLTIERHGHGDTERGYNTNGVLYLDQQRPAWNQLLRLGDLASIDISGSNYYAFELDANEPGNSKGLISIDNIRIYTSATDNTSAVQSNEANLDSLGTLRWAMNQPLLGAGSYDIDQWIKLDGNQNQGNGGSGISDMILYIPITAFAGASADELVWLYNLNGVHYTADADLAAEAGYEEWRAAISLDTTPQHSVPDGGSTLLLLGLACSGFRYVARRMSSADTSV